MSEATVSRLRWRCRRGMRELDLVLESYLDRNQARLTAAELDLFARLLDHTDMDLYDWLTGRAEPGDPELARLVRDLAPGATAHESR